MNDLTHTTETPIDKAIFKLVASVDGGTQQYNTIVSELKRRFTPKKVTMMLYSTTSMTTAQIDQVYEVLKHHDVKQIIKKGDLL